MRHLTDTQLTMIARRGETGRNEHLNECQDCRIRLTACRNLLVATTLVAEEVADPVAAPSFNVLLGESLPHARHQRTGEATPDVEPLQVAGPGLGTSWRLVAALVARQPRLLPRALLPVTAVGLLGAVLLALATPQVELAVRFFGAMVTLVVLTGSVALCSPRSDPRMELLFTMPISPASVFASRLVLVMSVDLVLAMVASVVVCESGGFASLLLVVSSWLGQAMLSSAIGVAVAVWRSPQAGGVAGVTVWLLGSASTLPSGVLATRLGVVASQVWVTTPWTMATAVFLLAMAAYAMRIPRPDRSTS